MFFFLRKARLGRARGRVTSPANSQGTSRYERFPASTDEKSRYAHPPEHVKEISEPGAISRKANARARARLRVCAMSRALAELDRRVVTDDGDVDGETPGRLAFVSVKP